MTPEEFRTFGHQVIDWITDYRSEVDELPVMSTIRPGDIRDKLPAKPPEDGESFDAVMADLNEIIMPGITHWNHPDYFAYFPSNATLSSVLGDIISSGIGGIGLNWQSMPALTEVEEVVTEWMRLMLGLSAAWEGVIQDSASTSTLVALLSARERVTEHAQVRGGLQSEAAPLVVYCSTQSHSSVKKAALLAGFGLANVRVIGTDENYAMDVNLLTDSVEQDIAEGLTPCVVVATTGTTTTTAIDPIAEIGKLTKKYGLWLHVDAAMAGTAMIVPEYRWMWEGIEDADSLVLNPHKWLGVIFDTSLYYVRDSEHLVRVMSTNPSYLQTSADDEAKNYRDWGIPLGRRFRALKLWCAIRDQGVRGLQARVQRDLDNAQWLKKTIDAASDWEILAPVVLQTLCVRHLPAGVEGDALDAHTMEWVTRINESGDAYLTPAKLDERWMVRVSVGAEATELKHVKALWQTMQAAATSHLVE
jgi:aromatic-L-amino-acid/L-tryptophan decarboxylase